MASIPLAINHSAQTPTVSVIIPCYNSEASVGAAIESALGQTYPSVEVIVIDDGSTDSSLDVIRSFGERICWQTGPNRGACAARNVGLALAQGTLIQFLDADDLLFPTKLEAMVPTALEGGQRVLAVCNWLEQDVDPELPPRNRIISYQSGDPFNWCLLNTLQTSSPLHWRSCLLTVNGFDEALPCCQEYDLHLRLLSTGIELRVVDTFLFIVNRQEGSLSADYVKVLRQHPGILLRARAHLQNQNLLSLERNVQLAFALSREARHLVQRRNLSDARMFFLLAEAIHPHGMYLSFHQKPVRWIARILSPLRTAMLINWFRKNFVS